MKKSKGPNQHHNDLFINIMKDKENITDFLKNGLPVNISKHLDLYTIDYDDTNYVKNDFKNNMSDLVVKTTLKESQKPVDIYLLIEHKSVKEPQQMIFMQLFNYFHAMFQQDMNNGEPLRVIIPMIFYHGNRKWTVPSSFIDLFDVPKELKGHLLNFNYSLVNTKNSSFIEKVKDNALLYSTMLAFKEAFKKENIDVIKEIIRTLHEAGLLENIGRVEILIRYIFQTKDVDKAQLKAIINSEGTKGEEIIMNVIEQHEAIGAKKGKIEVATKMLEKGYPLDDIADITGLPLFKIKELKQSLTK